MIATHSIKSCVGAPAVRMLCTLGLTKNKASDRPRRTLENGPDPILIFIKFNFF